MRSTILTLVCLVLFCGCISGKVNSQLNTAQKDSKQDDKKDPLLNPSLAAKTAPKTFKVKFETTKGDFVIDVNREWSPKGADRFYSMVEAKFFKDIAIFRAIDGFMFQFGIHGDPKISKAWKRATIDDDESVDGVSNVAGYISFATSGKDSRTTQMFVNLGDNGRLDGMGFTPFGKVVEGMEVVKKVETKYGENNRRENIQGNFQSKGNEYIKEKFPDIDYIKSVTVIEENGMKK